MVRQRSAKPLSAVRSRPAPPTRRTLSPVDACRYRSESRARLRLTFRRSDLLAQTKEGQVGRKAAPARRLFGPEASAPRGPQGKPKRRGFNLHLSAPEARNTVAQDVSPGISAMEAVQPWKGGTVGCAYERREYRPSGASVQFRESPALACWATGCRPSRGWSVEKLCLKARPHGLPDPVPLPKFG